MSDIKKISLEGKMSLTETEVAKISGGVTWEELLEGSRNFLPEGNVTCTFCGKSFKSLCEEIMQSWGEEQKRESERAENENNRLYCLGIKPVACHTFQAIQKQSD